MMKKKGFTLIELLVVVAIIGILTSMALVALSDARQRARDARRVSDIRQIMTALELYYLDYSRYPTTASQALTDKTLTAWGFTAKPGSGTVYMADVPNNPKPATDKNCAGVFTTDYYWYSSSDGSTYGITYCIGSTTGDLTYGLHTATPAGIR